MASSAPVQWAQRGDSIYLTIVLPDVKDAKIDLTEDKLVFSGVSNGKEFKADLEFFEAVDPKAEASKYEVKPRNIQFHIVKKDETWWPRLLKDKTKEKNQVAIDWTRYVDEDEADEKPGFDMGQFGAGAGGFGGMGGMGGDDEDFGGMGGMGGMGGLGGMMGGMGGGAGGMDMAKLQAMLAAQGGGMGGMGGMNFGGGDGADGGGDSDDDDLPDLAADEEEEAK